MAGLPETLSSKKQYIVSLSTIPSRFSRIGETLDSILRGTVAPLKIVVNVPRVYDFRLGGVSVPEDELRRFTEKYCAAAAANSVGDSAAEVVLNLVDRDMGPGTKIWGLFQNGVLPEGFLEDADSFVVLVDDDFIYKPYMLEWFGNYIDGAGADIEAASFWVYDIGGVKVGQGADGFFLRANTLGGFLPYFERLAQEDYLLYHDDFCVSFYYSLRLKPAHYMTPPYGSLIYDASAASAEDTSLFKLQGKYERNTLNWKCLEILRGLALKL
jgi:hypothetical protein